MTFLILFGILLELNGVNPMKNRVSRLLVVLFCAVMFSSCGKLGYSVNLWTVPEHNLSDCDIVPVYVKSYIKKVYIIGAPDGKKIEVPFWQISEPSSKGKAKKYLKSIREYKNVYAVAKLDGLPCRQATDNIAKQVYRLRKGEIIKVLQKGEGQIVTNGKETLEGDWLKILTKDGTVGWCFSYSLNVYTMDEAGNTDGSDVIVEEVKEDEAWNNIYSKTWYPENYRTMIESECIDLTIMKTDYLFKIDQEKEKVMLSYPANQEFNTKAVRESWDFNGYTKSGRNQYQLTDTSVIVLYQKEDYIVVRYTDKSGKPLEFKFISFAEEEQIDVEEIIKEEKSNRYAKYGKIVQKGPSYGSSNYGHLNFTSGYKFTWVDLDLLVPQVLPDNSSNSGSISIIYGVSKKYVNDYDGVLTFNFDGINQEINFLYKIEDGGLLLEDATTAKFEEGLITDRGYSPLVLYFQSQ